MQSRREYLAGLSPPLAIAGARGRLSKDGLAAIADANDHGIKFTDDPNEVKVLEDDHEDAVPAIYKSMRDDPVLRDIVEVSGYTVDGILVKSGICFKCARSVSRCFCTEGIKASSITARWSKESGLYGAPIDAA